MIIKKEVFPFGFGKRCVYTIDTLSTRKTAMLFALDTFENLPFENKVMHVDDALTTDEGTLATDFRRIENKERFIDEYLRSSIDNIIILGKYKEVRMVVGVRVNKSQIVIAGTNTDLVQEVEQMLFATETKIIYHGVPSPAKLGDCWSYGNDPVELTESEIETVLNGIENNYLREKVRRILSADQIAPEKKSILKRS